MKREEKIDMTEQVVMSVNLLREKLLRLLPKDFVISQIIIKKDLITVKE